MPRFDKEGRETKGKFRVYCHRKGCNTFVMGRWGGGYGGVITKHGEFDSRNQVWDCGIHKPRLVERTYRVWECSICGREYPKHEKERAEQCCKDK